MVEATISTIFMEQNRTTKLDTKHEGSCTVALTYAIKMTAQQRKPRKIKSFFFQQNSHIKIVYTIGINIDV